MAAEALDQIDDNIFDVSVGVGLQVEATTVQTQALSALGNGFPSKVRKPYTITKQREKWTDEEHQRFLEALKLYGRAWRQIEEHVGTKTAIQIRSHAQKFFAKVTRDSKSDCEGSLNPIEIPPPRPKKKPLHPYPRKVVDCHKVCILDSSQSEKSPSPNVPIGERESKSPTSVFSAIGSETCESPFLELQKSRLSPASCTTDDAHSANAMFENDNECMTSNFSLEEEKGSFESIHLFASAATDDKSSMELEFLTLGRACFRVDPPTEATSSTIKLFGRTVIVNENHKSSSSAADNHELSPSDATKEKLGIGNGLPTLNSTTDNVDPQFTLAYVPSCITPLPILLPPHALSKEFSHSGAVPSSIPWGTWHQGLIFPQVAFGNLTAVETALDYPYQGGEENEHQREGSSTGSNSGSVSEVNSGHRMLDATDSKSASKIAKPGSMKGFVPYKRCLAERNAAPPIVAAEEREGQRPRVC